MLIQRTLRIKGGTSREVSMVDKPREKKRSVLGAIYCKWVAQVDLV
jgi:hypothetical protein